MMIIASIVASIVAITVVRMRANGNCSVGSCIRRLAFAVNTRRGSQVLSSWRGLQAAEPKP